MEQIILGVDPGSQVTGWGIIQKKGRDWVALDYGCIRPPKTSLLSKKYLIIFEGIESLIHEFSPQAVSVENQFIAKNPMSALKLGMARSSVMLAAARKNIPLFVYPPKRAKKAIVGVGSASKEQVQKMLQNLLNLSQLPTPEDAADALLLALCHAYATQNSLSLGEAI